jgi:hypothetical protein
MSGAIDERCQQIEGPWPEWDGHAGLEQASLVEFELEGSKAVTSRRAGRSRGIAAITTCLPSPLATDGQEGQLPAQSKTILSRLPIQIQSKWSKNRRAFGISTRSHDGALDGG